MDYWKWNDALGDFFFRQSRPEQRILLYLDRKLINRIGLENGLGQWEDFCAAVKEGPVSVSFPHYLPDLVRSWTKPDQRETPFFLNGIAILVLAWTDRPNPEMGYYEALGQFCSQNLAAKTDCRPIVKVLVNAFSKIRLWSESWPDVPGTFADEPLQNYRYVGRIKHHALVAPHERDNLHFLWQKLKLEPGTTPSMEWLVHLVENAPEAGHWIPRIIGLLAHRTDLARKGIREWLGEELRNWKGIAPKEPQLFIAPLEDGFELRYSLDRRRGWGLRLCHPTWTGRVEMVWNGFRLEGEIGSNGWSERLLCKGDDFQVNLQKDSQPLVARLLRPVSKEFPAVPQAYYFPADALGAFGADFIGHDRMVKERPFHHLFKKEELGDWKKWALEKEVQNWRIKDIALEIPNQYLLYWGDVIPKQVWTSSPPKPPQGITGPPIEQPVFPLRAADLGDAWQFDPTGKRSQEATTNISHFWIKGTEDISAENTEWTISQQGRATLPPPGFDLLTPLLRHSRSTISFKHYYDCLEKKAEELDETLEKIDARYLRKATAALGYFFEDPSQRKLQLSPPSLTLLPDNHFHIRASLTGIWTSPLIDELVQWCADPKNGMVLQWLEHESPFLPPTGQLNFFQMELLHKLHSELEKRFPGTVGICTAYSYAQTLIETIRRPSHTGWFPDGDGLPKRDCPLINFALSPSNYRFVPASPIPSFPLLTRVYNERFGYPMYIWWEDAEKGFECNGEWAVWQLLHAHQVPVLFTDPKRSDRIFLPADLPLPQLVERALTMASGRANSYVICHLPNGTETLMRCFDELRFSMRQCLPALLLGADPDAPTKPFFHSIGLEPQPKNLEKWTN